MVDLECATLSQVRILCAASIRLTQWMIATQWINLDKKDNCGTMEQTTRGSQKVMPFLSLETQLCT